MPAPGTLRIEAGMYRYADGKRLPTAQGDSIALGSIDAAALTSPDGIPNPMRAVFGDKIALTGYSLDRRSLRARREFPAGLMVGGADTHDAGLQSVCPPDAAAGRRMGAAGPAAAGWGGAHVYVGTRPGRCRTNTRSQFPPDAPPGIYDVAVGLYDKDTYDRLQINNDDLPIILARVRVEP